MDFTGEFRHSIDAKGRLIVPSSLREPLGRTVRLSRWLDNCIAVWSEEGWDRIVGQLQEQGRSNPKARRFVRQFTSSTSPEEIDKQGRVSVSQKLRDLAGIDKSTTVIGALDHVELWDPERWAQHEADTTPGESFDDLASGLDF
ncbi:MAG: division/cell wall cluster transcriptional repressor MraZ [Actinobacteria bacterium]|nr:division/cell wall cluster transcriptional repressor MraZ [Actinomycetota bacterium]